MSHTDLVSRNALLASIRDRVHQHGGVLEVYAGVMPANVDADLSGHTLLASRVLGLPTFAVPNAATLHAMLPHNDTWAALASGRAAFYRVTSLGVPLLLGAAGQGVNNSLRVVNADLVAGADVAPSGWAVECAD